MASTGFTLAGSSASTSTSSVTTPSFSARRSASTRWLGADAHFRHGRSSRRTWRPPPPCRHHTGANLRLRHEVAANLADKAGFSAMPSATIVARALQRRLRVRHVGIHELAGERRRIDAPVLQDALGEGPKAALAGGIGAVAALRGEGKVEILERDARPPRRGSPARSRPSACPARAPISGPPPVAPRAPSSRRAAFPACATARRRARRRFLAVARDEGHRRAAVEKRDRLRRPGGRAPRSPRRSRSRWCSACCSYRSSSRGACSGALIASPPSHLTCPRWTAPSRRERCVLSATGCARCAFVA